MLGPKRQWNIEVLRQRKNGRYTSPRQQQGAFEALPAAEDRRWQDHAQAPRRARPTDAEPRDAAEPRLDVRAPEPDLGPERPHGRVLRAAGDGRRPPDLRSRAAFPRGMRPLMTYAPTHPTSLTGAAIFLFLLVRLLAFLPVIVD